jgi:DNA end-binding protein Ku
MRSIWTGSIGFGLVNIPVKLYSATQDSRLDLDMLDKSDMSNIRFQRVNAETGKEVAWDNIVKAYKYDNQYVVLDPGDFEAASAKKSRVIEVVRFVRQQDIDSTYYEAPYYLEPEKSGYRAYGLLREAMKKSGKVGVATFVLRTKEHLAILKPSGDVIVLNRIRFAQEVRAPSELDLTPAREVKQQELDLALSLIDQLTGTFDIREFRDTYSEHLMKVIEAKARGRKVVPFKGKAARPAGDLMSQLKSSLSSTTKRKKAG